MSKCELTINFERDDRQYSTGERVTGTVMVQVNQDVNCQALKVSGLWRTHGRGNRAQGEYDSQILASGQWRSGQMYEFPFQIAVPDYPLTYRGNFLNVDHYVSVRVDVPWAFDPKAEEEFLLLPAANRHYAAALPAAQPGAAANAGNPVVATIIGIVFVVIGLISAIFTCGISLIFAAIGLAILGFGLRRTLAEQRLGMVEVSGLPIVCTPNTKVPFEINFTPKKSGKINGINVQILGDEVCVSGSGSNRRTHTHNLWKQPVLLQAPQELRAGEPVRIRATIDVPETTAYSVDLSDNKIVWKARIQIDIPKWPDWVKEELLHIIPPGGVGLPSAAALPAAVALPAVGGGNFLEQTAAAASVLFSQVPPTALPESYGQFQPGTPAIPAVRQDLTAVVERLRQCDRFSDEAVNLVDAMATDLFQVELLIDRINPTHGYFADEKYEDGQTIMGTIKGTRTNVSIQLPKDYNEQLSELEHGNIWTGQGVIIKWDALYERLEMMGF